MENEEENLVVSEETTENVGEQATEEVVSSDKKEEVVEDKVYTEKEFNDRLNELLSKKLSRKESKIRNEYEKKYSKLENVLSAGLGTNDLDEITNNLSNYYKSQGVEIPAERQNFSAKEEQILANAEANEIIASGYEDIVEEVERLAQIGANNMSTREKLIFKTLADERQKLEEKKELLSLGVDTKVFENEDYKNFIKENGLEKVAAKKAYELYKKMQPQPEVEQIGSMKSTETKVDKYKEYYTPDEVRKLTSKDLDDPRIMKAVDDSMTKW